MKNCPKCGKSYADDSLNFCLDDGEWLDALAKSEPATAFLSSEQISSEQATRRFDQTPSAISSLPGTSQSDSRKNSIIVGVGGIILVTALGFGSYLYYNRSAGKQIESIAVMPFFNESANADVEYLSDGLTETLISSLSKLGDLSVKARSAVFSYKGRDVSTKQIGDELGVQAVLLGRLAQRGENIRLNLELVDPKTLDVIWSEQYDRKQSDLVNLQSEIAQDVSSKLRSKLSGEDRKVLEKKYTNDPEAYRLYLQARFYLNKRVGKEYEKAEGFLRQAIERDPNFALGYVGLAEFVDDDDRPKSKEYILRALAIDSQLSEAHAVYGYQLALDRDWAASERELTRAIELDPRNVRAHQWNGTRLMFIGRHQECLNAYDRAIALEPSFADIRANRGTCIVAAGRLDDGIAELKNAILIDPKYPWAHSALSFLYRMKGDHAAAVEERARSVELLERPELAARFRDSFRRGGWTGYLNELLEQTSGQFTNEVRKASIYCELGQKEKAFAALERSAAVGEWWLFSIKYDRAFDPLRGDPRFQALVKQFEPAQ
jgi:TolB-like protein/Tfp pilus assembly protein PilF